MRLLQLIISCTFILAAVGCQGGQATSGGDGGAERDVISEEECAARGGTIVGDPGDGSTRRPDYVCPNGAPPIAEVQWGIEGAACCPE